MEWKSWFFLQLIHHINIDFFYSVEYCCAFSKRAWGKQVKSNVSVKSSCNPKGGLEWRTLCAPADRVSTAQLYKEFGNVTQWQGLGKKNEATFLKGPCPFQTIIENNVKIVVGCGHGLTLWGQGQTLSLYFNFHMINYTPEVGWETCFTSSAGCSTLIS